MIRPHRSPTHCLISLQVLCVPQELIATFTPESKCGLTTWVNSLFFPTPLGPNLLATHIALPSMHYNPSPPCAWRLDPEQFSPPSLPLFTSVHQNIYGSYHPPFLLPQGRLASKPVPRVARLATLCCFLMFACSAVRATPFWVALGFGSN